MAAKIDRQALRSRSTKQRIVLAALSIVAKKGFTAASMDEFCVAAGCSKGGLYHHFRTKTDVLRAVIDRLHEADALVPPFRDTQVSLGLAPADVGRVLVEVFSAAARNADVQTQLRAAFQRPQGLQGEGNDVNDLTLVDVIRLGMLVQALTCGEPQDLSAAVRQLGIDRAA
jgi:AcrR family transcriptional regulator